MKAIFTLLVNTMICLLLFLLTSINDGPRSQQAIISGMNSDGRLGGQVLRDTSVKDKTMQLIADSLASTSQRLPVEKVYLHTDKPYYNIGDTIWFKAYVVDNGNHSPSRISNLLYVFLTTDSGQVADRMSFRITDGYARGQIPLRKTQYQEGSYTLGASTTWMTNFRGDYEFRQRFYLGTPTEGAWLVRSDTRVTHADNRNRLQVSIFLNRIDKDQSPITLKDVEVRVYDDLHRVLRKEMRTGLDGGLELEAILRDNINGRRLRVEITSLDPADDDKIIQVPLAINRSQKVDLQFLPEGGKLVAGLKSVVGFKALGEDGRSTPVSGSVFDSRGKRVASFTTLHAGMGSFELTPLAGENYTAKVEVAEGEEKSYPLPKVEPKGTVLQISNPEKAAALEISLAGLNSIPADSGFYLIGSACGKVCYAQKVTGDQPTLSVAKSLFPTGVVRFTLFNGITPLNERIVFIDHRDQLQIRVTPHKLNYGKRDSVSLAIEVKDKDGSPVQGHFSLSVTDDSQVKADSLGDYSIAASLLINADLKGDYGISIWKLPGDLILKGEVESPGYYMDRTNPKAWEALDKLMLTQGWTDYTWETVFSPVKYVRFKAQNSFDITGRVLNILNEPVVGTQVLVSSQKPPFIAAALTDKNGNFVFKDLLRLDSGSFFFQANTRNGKPITFGTLVIDRPYQPIFPLPAIKYPILPWYVNSDTTGINLIRRKLEAINNAKAKLPGIVLEEVKITTQKKIRGSRNPYGPANADYVVDEHDIRTSGLDNLYDLLTQKIPGIRAEGTAEIEGRTIAQLKFKGEFLDVKIDGNRLTININKNAEWEWIEALSKYQLSGIRGIELAHSRKYTEGIKRPSLTITTYKGMGGVVPLKAGTETYRPLPVTRYKVFYQPKYTSDPTAFIPDYRPTVYWDSDITTDQDGRAMVSFYTSDSTGGLTLNLQGMGTYGGLGSAFLRIKP